MEHPDLEDTSKELVLQDWQELDALVTVGDLIDRGYTLAEIFQEKKSGEEVMNVVVGKRYTNGFVNVKVKEISTTIMLRGYNDGWSPMVVCDTPSSTKDVGLPLADIQDYFEEEE